MAGENNTSSPGEVEFGPTMDPDSLDIKVDGRIVGSLQRHQERPPRVVFIVNSTLPHFDLSFLQSVVEFGTGFVGEA